MDFDYREKEMIEQIEALQEEFFKKLTEEKKEEIKYLFTSRGGHINKI